MKLLFATATLLFGLAVPPAVAQVINAPLTSFELSEHVDLIGGPQLHFGPQAQATATANVDLGVSGIPVTLIVSGQNAANSLFSFLFAGVAIATNVDLNGNGNDIDTFTFTPAAASGSFVIRSEEENGSGKFQGHIDAVSFAVPGPIAGAGIPALLSLAGLWYIRRRKQILSRA